MGFGDDISANQNEQLNETIDKIIKKGLTNENIVLDSLGNINENKEDDYEEYEEFEF